MNKKLIALVSSVAFILTPATSVLAEGNETDVPSAENHTEVVGEESPENHTEFHPKIQQSNESASSKTKVTYKGDKTVYGAKQYSLDNKVSGKIIPCRK